MLAKELERRKGRNPRYSLRAFAHFLEMEPSALSRILAGKQQISLKATRRVVGLLQLNPQEQDIFLSSVAEGLRVKVSEFLDLTERADAGCPESLIKITASIDPSKIDEINTLMKSFVATLESICGGCEASGKFELMLRSGVGNPRQA